MNTKQSAVEWLVNELQKADYIPKDSIIINYVINQSKEIENKAKLRNQLFIGKIHEVLGYDKTIELLKECYKEYPI